MYQQLKDRYIGDGEWIQICREDLNICSQTANRYISFYELVSVYPRIVITSLTFETIMYCKAEILEELARDFELSMRFKMPLREVSINAAMNIGGGWPTSEYEPTADDVSTNTNWDAAWEFSDMVLANVDEHN